MMKKPLLSILIIAGLVAGGLSGAAFLIPSATPPASGTEQNNQNQTDNTPEPKEVEVSIPSGAATGAGNGAYNPYTIEINVGDTVIWTNDDAQPHTVTSGANGQADGEFNSSPNLNPLLAPGQTFEHTFEEAGEFEYFCILHPSMVGIVKVVEEEEEEEQPEGQNGNGTNTNEDNDNETNDNDNETNDNDNETNDNDNETTTGTVSEEDRTSGGGEEVAEVVVYSIWVQENETGGNTDVFFAKSEDGGQTFSDPINLSDNEVWSTEPRIAVADNHVHVVWLDYETSIPGAGPDAEDAANVTIRSSDDGGETFADAVLVSDEENAQERTRLQIEATTTTTDGNSDNNDKKNNNNNDDSNVYISWVVGATEELTGQLTFAKSDDSGQSFEVTEDLVDEVDEVEMEVAAAASDDDDDDADKIYFAGDASSEAETPAVDQIFFLRSTDGGETFDDPILLEDVDASEEFVRFESLEVDDDEIQVTWIRGGTDPEEIHFAVSTDGGETWGG